MRPPYAKFMYTSLLSATTLLVPAASYSSGFALLEQSSSGLGAAFAGSGALAEDASTIFYNAAGLARLDKPSFTTSVTGVNISSKFYNQASQPALGQQLGTGGGQAGSLSALPAVYGSLPIGTMAVVGIGMNVPFGLKTEYDSDWMGRFQAIKSDVRTFNVNPSLGIKLGRYVSLGVGADFQQLQAELSSGVNYTAVIAQVAPGLVPTNTGLQGTSVVRGDDTAWGFDAGVLFDLPSKTRIGFAYRSGMNYTLEGTVKFNAPTATDAAGAQIIAGANASTLANGPVQLHIKLPASARASLVQKVTSSIDVLADVSWTQWSNVQQLAIKRPNGTAVSVTPEAWRDTWRYALGASYALNHAWKVRAGIAYDQAPVPESTRTPRLPDEDRKWVSVGAQWQMTDVATLDAGYAHVFVKDAQLNQNEASTAQYGLLNGEQRTSIDILGAQISVKF